MSDMSDTNGNKITLNESAPANLTVSPEGKPNSKLAHILVNLGYNLNDIEEMSGDIILKDLQNKKVSFMTMTDITERGTFARIVEKSLKLI